MTRKQLKKYRDIEIRLKLLRTTIISDSVVGSSSEYPYTAHSISLHGVQSDKKARYEIKELDAEKKAIDDFIDEISDPRAKNLIDLHYRKGWSWCKVSHETGKTMDANKDYLKKFFKTPLLTPCNPL